MTRAAVCAAALLCAAAASAPPEPPPDDRTRALFGEIRCVVCQNESIADSQAELAADLRGVVREQIAAGRTDAEIRAFLVERYGEFVMFRPAFTPANALLWLGPFVAVAAGAGVIVLRMRRVRPTAPLNPEEVARLRALAAPEATEPDDRNLT